MKTKGKALFALVASLLMVLPIALGGCGSSSNTQTGSSTAKKLPVIALSNSFIDNEWRQQMVASFVNAAKEAEKEGKISDYIVSNSTNGIPEQISQMNALILKHVDVICIDAATPTALNGVIEKAHAAGIKVIPFDEDVTTPDIDCEISQHFDLWGTNAAEYVAKQLNGKGNVIVVRTVAGTGPDIQAMDAIKAVFSKYPGIKIVADPYGQASVSITQSALSSILPSMPKIDAVICTAGAYGAVEAFQATNRPMPIITNGCEAQTIKWWIEQNKKTGYTTWGQITNPNIGAASFWIGIHMLEGMKIPSHLTMPLATITQADLSNYANVQMGTFAVPDVTNEWVMKNLLNS